MKISFKILIIILCAALLGGYLYYSPQQKSPSTVANQTPRLDEPVELEEPIVAVQSTAVLVEVPEVVEVPKPQLEPKPEAKVTVNPLEWIQTNWRGRIRSVTITKEQSVPVYAGGEQVGEATLPVGREVLVQSISEDAVSIHFLDNSHTIPINATDLEARAVRALSAAQHTSTHTEQAVQKESQTKTPTSDRFVTISTLKELVQYAAMDGNDVRLVPGTYQMADILNDEIIQERRKQAPTLSKNSKKPYTYMFLFDGSDNTFDLTDVTIEVDTQLLSAFRGCSIREFQIDGDDNTIIGLTVTDIGKLPTDRGGNSLTIHGDNNTLQDVTLNVSGSFPYGYGDYLGKGGKNIVAGKKHSGLLICGLNTTLQRCSVITRSFGHAFFIQGGVNTVFEDCYAEGEMRSTDAMLAETSGPAFDNNFASVYRPNVIQPGYMKSLNECGFRTYGSGGPKGRKTGKVTLTRCTAKNVRVGFALAADSETDAVIIDDCSAIGCERGYYLSKSIARNSKGDATYGPLLYLIGDEPSDIELTLLPETSDKNVHAIATISGKGHKITIDDQDGTRAQKHPIMLGFSPPGGGEISGSIGEATAEDIELSNQTNMPLIIGSKSNNCKVNTSGDVTRNDGRRIRIR